MYASHRPEQGSLYAFTEMTGEFLYKIVFTATN